MNEIIIINAFQNGNLFSEELEELNHSLNRKRLKKGSGNLNIDIESLNLSV